MSTFRNPVGPQPSRVYWRRRLLVGLVLLAIIVIVILIVTKPGANPDPTSQPDTTSSSPSGTPTSDAVDPGDAVECDPAKVTVEASTDATSYEAGVNPVLSFTLKSLMTEPCSIAAGSDVQEFTITSGDELIWTSKDCQTDPVVAEGASYHLTVSVGELTSTNTRQFLLY